MKIKACATMLLGLVLQTPDVFAQSGNAVGASAPKPTWPVAEWNPNATGDDFVLPLPCGGGIAFRAVYTSGSHQDADQALLEDRLVMLGGSDEEVPAISYLRPDYVSGAFEGKQHERYFLIGKYEVTAKQYAVVMSGNCSVKIEVPSLPASDLSWFDAVDFSRKLNRWLSENAGSALPRASGRPGFVRLPSEAEWEFAARGGLAVSDSERANPTFLKSGTSLDDYAWFAGANSSGGERHPIGQRKPNPLNLYDVLGNVDEMVFDMFHMVRVSRLHGQAGAVVARGGSFRTTAEAMRSSTRTELPLYDADGQKELKLENVGFRVAIGAVAVGDFGRAQALQKQWDNILREAKTTRKETAIQTLERLLRETSEPGLRQQLRDVVADLGQTYRQRSELMASAIRQLWLHADTIRMNVLNSAQQLDQWQLVVQEPDAASSAQRKAAAKDRMAEERLRFDGFLSTYFDLVIQLATNFEQADVDLQASALRREFELLGDKSQSEQLEGSVKLVELYRRNVASRTTTAMRAAVIGDRKWLAR